MKSMRGRATVKFTGWMHSNSAISLCFARPFQVIEGSALSICQRQRAVLRGVYAGPEDCPLGAIPCIAWCPSSITSNYVI